MLAAPRSTKHTERIIFIVERRVEITLGAIRDRREAAFAAPYSWTAQRTRAHERDIARSETFNGAFRQGQASRGRRGMRCARAARADKEANGSWQEMQRGGGKCASSPSRIQRESPSACGAREKSGSRSFSARRNHLTEKLPRARALETEAAQRALETHRNHRARSSQIACSLNGPKDDAARVLHAIKRQRLLRMPRRNATSAVR